MGAKVALCQCAGCSRYLVRNREPDGPQLCEKCNPNDHIPLANLRGTLTDPKMIEGLALLSEECAEVIQRISKIMRWGWDADFEGTTQKHKLQTEIADVLAVYQLLVTNDIVNEVEVIELLNAKVGKFQEDAEGPKQRLMHLKVTTDVVPE